MNLHRSGWKGTERLIFFGGKGARALRGRFFMMSVSGLLNPRAVAGRPSVTCAAADVARGHRWLRFEDAPGMMLVH